MLSVALQTSDTEKQVLCRNYIGATLRLMGRWDESYKCHRETLDLARSLPDLLPLSVTLSNIGGPCVEMSRYSEATTYLSESLRLAMNSGNHLRIASAHGPIGKCHLATGEWTLAIERFRLALRAGEAGASVRQQICSQTRLALAFCARGEYAAADEALAAATHHGRTLAAGLDMPPTSTGTRSRTGPSRKRRD